MRYILNIPKSLPTRELDPLVKEYSLKWHNLKKYWYYDCTDGTIPDDLSRYVVRDNDVLSKLITNNSEESNKKSKRPSHIKRSPDKNEKLSPEEIKDYTTHINRIQSEYLSQYKPGYTNKEIYPQIIYRTNIDSLIKQTDYYIEKMYSGINEMDSVLDIYICTYENIFPHGILELMINHNKYYEYYKLINSITKPSEISIENGIRIYNESLALNIFIHRCSCDMGKLLYSDKTIYKDKYQRLILMNYDNLEDYVRRYENNDISNISSKLYVNSKLIDFYNFNINDNYSKYIIYVDSVNYEMYKTTIESDLNDCVYINSIPDNYNLLNKFPKVLVPYSSNKRTICIVSNDFTHIPTPLLKIINSNTPKSINIHDNHLIYNTFNTNYIIIQCTFKDMNIAYNYKLSNSHNALHIFDTIFIDLDDISASNYKSLKNKTSCIIESININDIINSTDQQPKIILYTFSEIPDYVDTYVEKYANPIKFNIIRFNQDIVDNTSISIVDENKLVNLNSKYNIKHPNNYTWNVAIIDKNKDSLNVMNLLYSFASNKKFNLEYFDSLANYLQTYDEDDYFRKSTIGSIVFFNVEDLKLSSLIILNTLEQDGFIAFIDPSRINSISIFSTKINVVLYSTKIDYNTNDVCINPKTVYIPNNWNKSIDDNIIDKYMSYDAVNALFSSNKSNSDTSNDKVFEKNDIKESKESNKDDIIKIENKPFFDIHSPKALYDKLSESLYGVDGYKKQISVFIWKILNNKPVNGVMLVAGQSGCGKTELIRQLQKLYPAMIVVDGTSLTAEGYKGQNKLGYNVYKLVKLSQDYPAYKPIFVIDEFDKCLLNILTGKFTSTDGSVLPEILRIVEGTNLTVEIGRDAVDINTEGMYFIFLGSFAALNKKAKKDKPSIGFGCSDEKEETNAAEIIIPTKDEIKSVLPTEIKGRVEDVIYLNNFEEQDFINILEHPLYSPIHKLEKGFGIKINVSDRYKKFLAHNAYVEGTGVRYLTSTIGSEVDDYLFDDPDIKEINLDLEDDTSGE